MKLKITDDTLIIFIYMLSSVMIIGQFLAIDIITSIAFAASFLVVFLLWGLHIRIANTLDLLGILITILSFAGAIITYTSLEPKYFYNWLMFASVFLYFSVCFKIKLKQTTIKTLFVLNFVVIAFAVLAYFLKYDSAFYVTNIGVRYLKFGFYNPNALALFLVVIVIIAMQYFFLYKVRFGFIIELCCVGFLLFLIVQTLSRTSVLAIVFFIIISLVFARKKHYYLPKNNFFKIIVSIFPLLFAWLYMVLIELVNESGIFSFLVSEGKGLDSRQDIWTIAFDMFKESPIFGSYGKLMAESELSQMHNSHMNVLVSYGAIVFVLVCIFLFFTLKGIIKNARGTKSALSVWGFVVCLMLGSGEAILFSGGLSFYLLVGQFILISNIGSKREVELGL